MRALFSVCAAIVLAAQLTAADATDLNARINEGRDALRRNEFVTAETVLSTVLEEARQAKVDAAAARALFFLGLLRQEQAQQATSEAAPQLRREAVRFYEESLGLYPNSGAALHNLAEVQALLGEYSAAREALQKALTLPSSRKALFAEKLGDIEAIEGQHKKALEAYRLAAGAAEPSLDLRQKLVRESFRAGDEAEDRIPDLWALAKSDRMNVAMSGAFDALLDDREKLDQEAVDALFGIIASGLARQNYSPAQLSEIGVATRLVDTAKKDDRYRPRVDAILALYGQNLGRRELFTAWPKYISDDDVPKDLSPRYALADLAGALGKREYSSNDYENAGHYFDLAREIGRPDDPRPLTDLASVAYAQKRLPELDAQIEKFEDAHNIGNSFSNRREAVQLYEYHRALGTMYAGLGRWTARIPELSAIHHLEATTKIAKWIEADSSAPPEQTFVMDGGVQQLLGDAYERVGRVADSTAARIEAAGIYAGRGDFASAREVVSEIAPSTVTGDVDRATYAKVVEPLVTFIGDATTIPDPAAVKGSIVVLWTTKDEAARADALKTLEKLGVRVMGKASGTVQTAGGKSVSFAVRTSG